MKKLAVTTVILAGLLACPFAGFAQYKDKNSAEEAPKTKTDLILEEVNAAKPVVITLEQALEIALSENVSVKVADLEIKRTEYAKKGAYAALFPQIDREAESKTADQCRGSHDDGYDPADDTDDTHQHD